MDQELVLRIEEDGADDDRLDSLTTTLRAELLALDVDDVRRPSGGAAPEGSRALELAAIGALLVTLKGSTEAISSVVTAIRGWLSRGSSGRAVEVTIGDRTLKLTAATPEQQDRVVAEFLRTATAG
jgi:Effector Associated Constant Component 1